MNLDTPTLENLSDRLNYALSITTVKKADLARSISVKPQIIQFLCSSKTHSSRFTFEIATALGLNTKWLATGEGEMFVEDDPKQQLIKQYQPIPVLDIYNVREVFLSNKSLQSLTIKEWLPLKYEDGNFFAIEMTDTSMEPIFPVGSQIFLEKCTPDRLSGHKFVFAYLLKFDTFVVRQLVGENSNKILKPTNMELFKEINVTDDVRLLGIVTDCFWRVRK